MSHDIDDDGFCPACFAYDRLEALAVNGYATLEPVRVFQPAPPFSALYSFATVDEEGEPRISRYWYAVRTPFGFRPEPRPCGDMLL